MRYEFFTALLDPNAEPRDNEKPAGTTTEPTSE